MVALDILLEIDTLIDFCAGVELANLFVGEFLVAVLLTFLLSNIFILLKNLPKLSSFFGTLSVSALILALLLTNFSGFLGRLVGVYTGVCCTNVFAGLNSTNCDPFLLANISFLKLNEFPELILLTYGI